MKNRGATAVALACLLLAAPGARADDRPLRDQAADALRKATTYFRTKVATEGGYLWRYSEDLTRREGEETATATLVWVQPPGTPTVGMAFLDAYAATGDSTYRDAARDAAMPWSADSSAPAAGITRSNSTPKSEPGTPIAPSPPPPSTRGRP